MDKEVCLDIYSLIFLQSCALLVTTIHSWLNFLSIYILSIYFFFQLFFTKLNLYTPSSFLTSKQRMKLTITVNDLGGGGWFCLVTQGCADTTYTKTTVKYEVLLMCKQSMHLKCQSVSRYYITWDFNTFGGLIRCFWILNDRFHYVTFQKRSFVS